MKKIIHFIFITIFFSLLINYVQADCTSEEISSLKREAEKIKVTYKHLGAVENEEHEVEYNHFSLTFKNVNDDFYVELFNFSYTNYPKNGIIEDTFTTGNWNFGIYSKKCESKVHDIKVVLPRFNIYSLDPLCNGIDSNDFALCGKYYNYDINYDKFKERVTNYRNTHEIISNTDDKKNNNENNISYYLKYIGNFITNNYIMIGISTTTLIMVIITIIVIKRKKNRGVLK